MNLKDFNRRDFVQASGVALSGLIAGSLVGCGDNTTEPVTSSSSDSTSDIHVCRGLNNCKGQGASGDNDCAGQGACATATAHSCHEQNDCKGQGGCGETTGKNACKGQGECSVPLMPATWENARKQFESAMTEQGKDFGSPPEADS